LIEDGLLTKSSSLGEQALIFGVPRGDKLPNLEAAEEYEVSGQRNAAEANGALFSLG
jgi:hypothetical protein